MGPLLLPIALAVGVASVGVSLYEGNKSANLQKQATQLQRQQVDLQAAVEKRNAIRQSRIAAASAQNSAAVQGVSDSSSAQGGVGSIQSQLDANLSFLDQNTTLADAASQKLGDAAIASAHASMFKEIGNFAFEVAGNSAKINQGFAKAFGGGG